MAIQNRRGKYADFDPSKMVEGEFAVVQEGDSANATDGKSVYISFQTGSAVRLARADEVIDKNRETMQYMNQAMQSAQAAADSLTSVSGVLSSIETKENEVKGMLETKQAQMTQAADQNISDINALATSKENEINTLFNTRSQALERLADTKEAEITAIKTAADATAAQALATAQNASNEAAETTSHLNTVDRRLDDIQAALDSKFDNAYLEDGYQYFEANNQMVCGPLGPFAGGGGGGGGTNNAILTVSNTSGWLNKTISEGSSCVISMEWSSLEDQLPTGNGTLRIFVNGSVRATQDIRQGAITAELKSYLSAGSNVVRATVSDVYGNARTINYSISVVSVSITSSFDATVAYNSLIPFPYTPVGAVSKTVHFFMDGTEVGQQTTTVSGRQMTYTFPAQSHGAHTIRCYFEAEINGETVRSNELFYNIICVVDGNTNVIITSRFTATEADQYDSIVLPYIVYDPSGLTADVTISANGTQLASLTVDRTEQSYTYRADEYGTLVLSIKSGSTTKSFTITVNESEIEAEAETEDLVLHLSSQGRSNAEENPGTWVYNGIAATFTGFNFTSDGWQSDPDGITVLRVGGSARLTIPYKPFASDFRGTGKTIEVEFATREVRNYDAVIFSCTSGGRGLSITAQRAALASEQSSISTQYKEDEHVRLAFVCEKRSENRLLLIYINGIASGVVQYPEDDDFSQTTPVGITVGSSDCVIDLYRIRVYDNDLTRYQVLTNYIADTQVGSLMAERYRHNDVYDAYGNVVISKLPNDLPYLVLEGPELPQYKGDKKTIDGYYVDPASTSKSFTFTGAQVDVQGTSSQYYPRKNYKIKFNNGFVLGTGETVSKYAMNSDAIPVKTFTFKADVASSEGANNVELVRLYESACPYKTPAQVANPKVRQGIDGFPIVVFYNDGSNILFVGKYNFNNDKGTEDVFGFESGDESWEIKNNTGSRVIWKSADYSGTDWLNDFEARYPDTDPAYVNPARLQELASWVVSTDPEQATGSALPSSVTYGETTYTSDTADYRLAKFKAEASNYLEIQSALFYYLFTELFLMVDSRAKNAFPSFMGSEVSA